MVSRGNGMQGMFWAVTEKKEEKGWYGLPTCGLIVL